MQQKPTIRQLSFLIALHEHQNFSKAAEASFVTQSTMSAGVKELENILDTTLVERTRRTVHFTVIGEKTVQLAKAILQQVDSMMETCATDAAPFSLPIRCGIIPTIAPFLLPNVINRLKKEIPNAKIYIREDQSKVIVDKLASGALDMIILALPYPMENVSSHVIGTEKFVAAVLKDHPFARQKDVNIKQFKQERVLLLEEGNCLRDHALSVCEFIDTDAAKEFQGTSLHTLVQMVDNGLGITILPQMALKADILDNTDIVPVPIKSNIVGREIALVWRKNSSRTEEMSKLIPCFEASLRRTLA